MIRWKFILIFILLVLLSLSLSCRRRLSPTLYLVDGETNHKLNNENCYYLNDFRLINSPSEDPLRSGDGSVLITNRSINDPDLKIIETGLIESYRQINYRLYISLPQEIRIDSLDIMNRSVCRIIGLFEKEAKYRHFECREGYIVIDTVKSSRFYARMYGKYYNFENDSLIFDGAMNVKRRK